MAESALHLISDNEYDFNKKLKESDIDLPALSIDTLQVNVTHKCNQACLHCHVDASPKRTEQMDKATVDK